MGGRNRQQPSARLGAQPAALFREQANGVDMVLGVPMRFGIGYGLPVAETIPYIPDEKICFWGGWGGSLIVMDVGREGRRDTATPARQPLRRSRP